MSGKRLSNLQKWTLVNCYEVTVLRKRASTDLSRCSYFDNAKCCDNVTPHHSHPNIYYCKTRAYEGVPLGCSAFEFMQNDIYRDYYGLELSRRQAVFTDTVYFKHTSNSDKIYNTTIRTLNNLEDKGLILYSKSSGAKMIILSDVGRAVAERLLDDKSINAKAQPQRHKMRYKS
jgi:hypothetical protein